MSRRSEPQHTIKVKRKLTINALPVPPPQVDTPEDAYPGSPRRYPISHEYNLIQFPLDTSRMLLRGDIVGLPLVSFKFFKDHILPELNVNYVADVNKAVITVYNACVEKGLIVDGRFVHFKKSPATMKDEFKQAKKAEKLAKQAEKDQENDSGDVDSEDEEDMTEVEYETDSEEVEHEAEGEVEEHDENEDDDDVDDDVKEEDDDDEDDEDQDVKVNEDTIFFNMKTLWKDVVETAKSVLRINPKVEYEHTPNANALMERPEGFKTDAISYLIKSKMPKQFNKTSRYFLCNAAVMKEDKIKNNKKNREDNMSKICYGCNHVCANDPLRRSVHGITVEDINLRLWLFCKAGGVVAEPLNWVENVKALIEVIIRLSFASHTSLGYDETMGRYWVNSKPIDNNLQYWIKVNDRRFRMVGRPLYDHRANLCIGSCTRVFAVIETEEQGTDMTVDTDGPKFALKISWPKEGNLEGEICKQLAILGAPTGEDRYFPKVVTEGVAHVHDCRGKEVDDRTSKVIVRQPLSAASKQFYPGPTLINQSRKGTKPVLGSALSRSVGGLLATPRIVSVTGLSNSEYTEPKIEDFIRIRWVDRVQYRIVFDGIGTPLGELETMYDIFHGLRDGVKAIKVLHKFGYLHRDLSIGNFLVHTTEEYNSWQLKLYDFEYVQRIKHFRTDEQVMTGTRQFMALEVLKKEYLYWALARQRMKSGNLAEPPLAVLNVDKPKYDFHYNPLHDLEPFLWMALWFLLYSVPVKPSSPIPDEDLEKQLDCAHELFSEPFARETMSALRYGCLTGGRESLPTVLDNLPQDFAGVRPQIELLAHHIMYCYMAFEGLPNFNGASTPELLNMLPEWIKPHPNKACTEAEDLGTENTEADDEELNHSTAQRKLSKLICSKAIQLQWIRTWKQGGFG